MKMNDRLFFIQNAGRRKIAFKSRGSARMQEKKMDDRFMHDILQFAQKSENVYKQKIKQRSTCKGSSFCISQNFGGMSYNS